MPFQKEAATTQRHWILVIWKSRPMMLDHLILFNGIWQSRFSCVIFCLLNVGSTLKKKFEGQIKHQIQSYDTSFQPLV